MKSDLIQDLLSFPEAIEIIELDIINKNQVLRSIEDQIIEKEMNIKADINAALDENGKKLYSNDQARQFAFVNEAKEDIELQGLRSKKDAVENQIRMSRISLEKLSNQQRNIRAVINHIEE
jgi:hypothetical protein